jgi:hypothetical protein
MSGKRKDGVGKCAGKRDFGSSKAAMRLEWLAGKRVRVLASAGEYGVLEPVAMEGVFVDAVQAGISVFIRIDLEGKARLIKSGAVVEILEL